MGKKRKHPRQRMATCLLILAAWLAGPGASAAPNGLFWSIEGDGEHRGYVLGTVHSEDARVLDFTDAFLGRLTACDTFAMELVPDLPTMERLLTLMQLPEDQSLAPLLGEDRYAAVEAAVASYGVPRERLARMKPWAVMMTLSLPPPRTGIFLDYALSLRADGAGRDVRGLETLEEQLSFLDDMATDTQIELLDQALAELERVQEVHDLMVDTYLENDLEALDAVARDQMAVLRPDTRDWFLRHGIDTRNRRMVDSALTLLDRGCTFIAVGALHLPGEQGVLALLEAAGFELSPLPSPFRPSAGDEPDSSQ